MDDPIGSGLQPEHYLNNRQRRAAAGINAKMLNNQNRWSLTPSICAIDLTKLNKT
jgi:hypothetical protein